MHFLVVAVLVWIPFAVFSNTYCPSSVSPKRGYYTPGSSNNTSTFVSHRYFSQSWAKLAEVVETIAEMEHPGWNLVLNSPVDGSRAPICFQLYINGKLWPEGNSQAQRCGASFYPENAMPEHLICPTGYTLQLGMCVNQNPNSNICPYKEQAAGEQDCCVGNPIYPSTGNKFEKEIDYQSGGPFPFLWIRYYNSDLPDMTRLGPQWRHHFDRRVWLLPTNSGVILERADGKRIPFPNQHMDGYRAQDPNLGRLIRFPQGGFWYRDRKTGITESFDNAGKLSNLVYPGGYMQWLIYDNLGKLVKIQDEFGKQITLFYDNHQRIAEMHTPAGQSYQYAYDDMGRLSKILYPDGTAKTYVYESKEAPNLLTGILNARGFLLHKTFQPTNRLL